MKKTNRFILAIILILIIGCNSSEDSNFIEESGNIEVTNIILSSQAKGQVERILASEGLQVNKGDTLLVIDHELLDIKLKQASININAARAALSLAIKGARSEDITLAKEQLNQAESNFTLANSDFNRMKNLFEERAITQKQFEDAETRLSISRSQLSAATENLKKIKNISRPEEIDQLQAKYDNAQVNLELIKKQIHDCHIISPIDGFIVERYLELGESVNFGSSIFKISNLSKVDLVVYVNEENLGKVKLGQSANVYTDSFKDKSYPGKIVYISSEAEFTPKNIQTKDERTKLVFAVKIELKNPDFELKAGMPADAKIKIID